MRGGVASGVRPPLAAAPATDVNDPLGARGDHLGAVGGDGHGPDGAGVADQGGPHLAAAPIADASSAVGAP
jgi:hypothetical protein